MEGFGVYNFLTWNDSIFASKNFQKFNSIIWFLDNQAVFYYFLQLYQINTTKTSGAKRSLHKIFVVFWNFEKKCPKTKRQWPF